jgi:Ca2+-binding RTX toxin-like protein
MRALRGVTAAVLALAMLPSLASAKPGDLIVGDTGKDGRILTVKPNGAVRTLSNDPDLLFPTGTTFSAAGRLFAADYGDFGAGAVFSVNPRTGAATGFDDEGLLDQPIHVDYHPNGFLYVPDFEADVLARMNPTTGAAVSVGDFDDPGFDTPMSVAVLPDGSMVVGRNTNTEGNFLRVQPDGAATPIATTGDPVDFAYGIAADAKGRVLIADTDGPALLRMVPRTGRVTRLAGDGLLVEPMQPAELPSGKIAVADGSNGIVIVNAKTGGQRQLVPEGEIGFAEGISVEPPKCFGRRANIVGTDKRDRLKGSKYPDVIAGLGGADVIQGLGAKDRLCGDAGRDKVRGGAGNDRERP